jgi:uncharacterized protein (DUF1778 family)
MSTKTIKPEKTRFDTRLSKEQKQLFERAAAIGGYRSLSDFVVSIVEERAQEIISQSESIIASQRDSEIFFDAIMNPGQPNDALKSAFEEYNKLMAE